MGQDHPDSKLFPHATGPAAKMVREHQKEEALKLYSGWVFFIKSRLFLNS
jgi:glutathione S-transferase